MSADNRIRYMEYAGQWWVWHGSGSQEYYRPDTFAHCFRTRAEAEDYARLQEQEIGYVEYGVQRITEDEQLLAISLEQAYLDQLKERIHESRKSGHKEQESEFRAPDLEEEEGESGT